ncbi:ABC transporter ATP-binding protein [Streptomyces sp. NBC_01803]|uniref:ABC transporter ATP-binding protein n=1 Tax=Streptomyces sp. NBC_01803 TaxID=2975946 RepID=UPI002DD88857|nr:ABC transporter ATP-binding protein [Streptomyces sp. NBC_01803]WSA43366.1 ABC transporter ATP-binding protein [Streptomyces sp. NBC_01803]
MYRRQHDERTPGPANGPDGDISLEVRDLRVEFTGTTPTKAVEGLDLTVRRGEIVALVGESGSGKSVTARAVMGLLPAGARVTEGSIALDGENVVGLPARRMDAIRGKRVAMLFQQPKAMLDPTATVRDQVAEPLWLHGGLSRRQAGKRVPALLADVGIPEPERRAGAYAHQLSGGMAQRVMIAAALAGDPGLLIADEPTTALDVTVQAQILRLLKLKQRESGMSVLLITHDLGIVASIADRVAVMYAGRIVEDGTTADLFADPQHPYTQALMKASLLEQEQNRLYTIPGSATQSRALHQGCRFRPRCTVAEGLGIAKNCESREPTLHACGTGHRSRCWIPTPEVVTA